MENIMLRFTTRDIALLIPAFFLIVGGVIVSEGGLYLTPLPVYAAIHKYVLLGCAIGASLIIITSLVHWRGIASLFGSEKTVSKTLILSSLFFSFGLWHSYGFKGWQGWMLYPSIGIFFSTLGISTLAYILVLRCCFHNLVFKLSEEKLFRYSVGIFFCMSCVMAWWAYEGIPHFGDAAIYAAEANLILSGDIASNSQGASLLVYPPPINEGPNGIFGKYPYGWPLFLALFVNFNIGWLANPLLVILLAFMLRKVVSSLYKNEPLANVSAVVFLLSGFSVIASTEWLSHLTVCLALMIFYYFYDKSIIGGQNNKLQSLINSTFAGMALFYAIHTRQLDSFVFTLPIVAYSIYALLSRFSKVVLPLINIGIWGIAAVALHFRINQYLRGDALESPYGGNYAQQVAGQASTAKSELLDYVLWAHQSIVDIGYFWFAGAAWAIGFIVVGIRYGNLIKKRTSLFFACWGAIFLSYGAISFYGLGWFGPRWYYPLLPVASLCIAGAILYFKGKIADAKAPPLLAKFSINYLTIACLVSLTIALPNWAVRLKFDAPFSVNTQLMQEIEKQNIQHAVVGVFNHEKNLEGKLFRNVISQQTFPLETSEVIFVIMRDGWAETACNVWPDRNIYALSETTGFDMKRIVCAP
ncbi:hypothetical protein BK026_08425 [Alteromonas sp. V450]|uniref:hypothetical protein n=1 Tax=Alteromonas sp. V450 TaxID=1912139 RepID=UPI0008FF3562|nr:hypothetical protein [Alteromonas sp. V450]OJF68813.1 hypothetical protein BK026_08425 [Alteromonas sp. V450]